jgi:hypothetical protein
MVLRDVAVGMAIGGNSQSYAGKYISASFVCADICQDSVNHFAGLELRYASVSGNDPAARRIDTGNANQVILGNTSLAQSPLERL